MDQWNEGGGGYFGQNGADTPTTANKSKPAARQQFLCPVTIRQLLEAPEDGLKVGNNTATMVTLVGIVTKVDVSSTNVKFTLSDDTGVIDCMDWIESEEAGETRKATSVMENSYYQVYGCIKSPQGKRRIMVFKVVPIEDFNDYTAFMTEVICVNRYAEKANSAAYMPMDTSSLNIQQPARGNIDDGFSTLTPVQRALLTAIKAVESQVGWSKNDPVLRGKFSAKMIDDALDYLVGEGHIYSTIDDDHFSST